MFCLAPLENGGLFTGAPRRAAFPARYALPKILGGERFCCRTAATTGMRYLSKVNNEEWMRERGT